jgi:serine/threonine-protein kinase
LFLVLAGASLAVLQRAELVGAQELLDLGLVFEVAGSCALALMENAAPWPNSPHSRSSTVVTMDCHLCHRLPEQTWKSITAAITSAAIVPCAHLVASTDSGFTGAAVEPISRLFMFDLCSLRVDTLRPAHALHQLQEDLSGMQDFGSYRLEKLLGRGGMGEVWLARHSLLRRDAAVKLILPELLEARAIPRDGTCRNDSSRKPRLSLRCGRLTPF